MFEEKMIVEDGANGAIPDVLICPVGKFVGSNSKGEPVPQNFTQESLEAIAASLNQTGKEILCDADHASAKEGLERNTRAVGWFSKFVANAKGLFGLLKLTKWGRELISNREYRSVSPVFSLNDEAEPTALLSVASTNTPALAVPENIILNSEPEQSTEQSEDAGGTPADILDMTKEELITIVNEAIEARLTTLNQQATTEEVVVNQGDSVSLNQGNEPNEPSRPTTPCEPAGDEKSQNDTPSTEEPSTSDEPSTDDLSPKTVSDKAETPKKAEDEKSEPEKKDDEPEVIKEEVLNSAPTTSIPKVEEEWRNLKGAEFRKWCAEHAHYCNTYRGE